MKLLLALLSAATQASRTLEILQKYVNTKDVPYVPQTEYTNIKRGDDLTFTVEVVKNNLDNFVVITSADGKKWKGDHGYNFVANVRANEIEFYNELFKDKMVFDRVDAKSMKVTVKGDTGDNSYMVLGLGDVMAQEVEFQVSNKVHRANVYNVGNENALDLYYELVNGKPELVCCADSTERPDLTFTTGLTYQVDGKCIRASQPNSAWFSKNRNTEWISCKTPFEEKKVLRFIDLNDAKQNGEAALVGWDLEHECGPVPANAQNVRLYMGKQIEKDYARFPIGGGQQGSITMTKSGDKLKFTGVKAEPAMQKAVMCAFFDNRDKCLGYSAPAKYVVIEKADPVTVTASLNTPQCGFDVTATEQEVGTCSSINGDKMPFPATLLQWEVTKADGSIIKYPAEPKKTTQLPLVLTLGPELKGATAVCYDHRVGMDEPRRANVPTGAPALTLTKHTSVVNIRINGDAITCESDAFEDNDQCSDVAEVLTPDVIMCPATMTPMHATCSLKMKDGSVKKSNPYENPDCLVEPNPPKFDEQGGEIIEEGGSMWTVAIVCFVGAIIGGVVLVFLNKNKESEYAVTTEDDGKRDLESAINDDEACPLSSGKDDDSDVDTMPR